MAHVPVVLGQWMRNNPGWLFEVDHARGGRMFYLTEGCTHRELVEMAIEDFLLNTKWESVELSYALPDEMRAKMPPDTPPTTIWNDRQVRSMIEFSKSHLVRLCVSLTKLGTALGQTGRKNDVSLSEQKMEDVRDEHLEDVFEEDMVDEMDDEIGDGLEDDVEYGDANLHNDHPHNESAHQPEDVKEEVYDADEDYSLYGKLENEDEDAPDLPFDPKTVTPTQEWSDTVEVGRSYPSKNALISELRLAAVMQKFAFTTAKSNKTLILATCVVQGCQWRVRASVKNEPTVFWVTKYVKVHTCSITDRSLQRRRCTPRYIARLFMDRVGIIDGITPQHIKDAMMTAHGLRMDYSTSYRAMIFARELVRGTAEDGYDTLPSYLNQIKETNPGSVTELVRDEANRFKYLFISLGASIHGFQYLRRVLVVDGTHLTGTFGGVLLVAAGQDANFQIFPLAFAVVDSECDESWEWFFNKLRSCVTDQYPLAIISDRHSSIAKACSTVMPWATRGICYYHLQQNIISGFRGRHLMHLVRGATYAHTVAEFDRNMGILRQINPALANYLDEADPKLWSRVHFPGERYNIQTSNIAESINSVVKQAKGFPIAYLLEFIRERLGRWFWKRREDALSLTTHFSRGVETLLAIRGYYADMMVVQRIGTWIFHVKYRRRGFTVDLERRMCSCGLWDVEKIACSHAIAAAVEARIHVNAFVSESYSKNNLYGTYSLNIYPTGEAVASESVSVYPPEIRVPPGRKRKSRWQTWLELSRKFKANTQPRKATKHYNCSNCKKPGHRRTHCVSQAPV